jgi:hypothetical protein
MSLYSIDSPEELVDEGLDLITIVINSHLQSIPTANIQVLFDIL